MVKRNIFFDVTTFFDSPFNDGIRRATKEMFFAMSSKSFADCGIRITPIVFEGFTARVQYSPVFKDTGFANSPIDGRDVQLDSGDVLFVPVFDLFVPERHFNFQHLPRQMKIVTVVYDLLPILNPQWFPKGTSPRFKSAIDNQIFYSDSIIVNSKKVQKDLLEYIQLEKFLLHNLSVHVLPLIGLSARINGHETISNHQPPLIEVTANRKFRLLSVGTIEPRKGHLEILEEFRCHAKENPELTLTFIGRLGWGVEKELALIKKTLQDFPAQFFWLDNASDSELEELYKSSTLYIAASYDEGFGLPVIEALRRHLPVLGRGIEVFREISEGQIVTFGDQMDFPSLHHAFQDLHKVTRIGHERLQNFRPRNFVDFERDILTTIQKVFEVD